MSNDIGRIAVLFSRLSGYMAACLKKLRDDYGIELLVYRNPPADSAPFDDRYFDWIDRLHDRTESASDEMLRRTREFSPDAVLMVGWVYDDYLKVARKLRNDGIPVIAGSDAQWHGSMRQQVARVIAPWYLHPAIDKLWVAGERQRQLAHRLGFSGQQCMTGYYACDWEPFAAAYRSRRQYSDADHFLFTGRYAPVKGLDTLVEAYQRYRKTVSDPWRLTCVGDGDQRELLEGTKGIVNRGFVQPSELPEAMAAASAFVLPSRREPWGVVVQEAAAAGLPLICSDACGSAVHLLQDGYNGYLFETGNPDHLAESMARMTELSRDDRAAMSDRSHELSKQFTPERWAETLIRGIRSVRGTALKQLRTV